MLRCSTILPGHFQVQKQPLEDYTYCSYTEVQLAPSLPLTPNRVHKTVCSSALALNLGAKNMAGVVRMCLCPDPGAVIVFDLFCEISLLFLMPKQIRRLANALQYISQVVGLRSGVL